MARTRRAVAVVVVVQLLHRVSRLREGAAAARGACRRRPCARLRLLWRCSARASRRSGRRARALAHIIFNDVGDKSNRKLVEFQEAVVAARGIPLIVRALGAADAARMRP